MSNATPDPRDLDQHPAAFLMQLLFSYSATKDILSVNSFEVLRFVQEIETGRFSEIALNRSRRMEYRDYENHMIRYLHNFLAAVKTMVEHTRNMMRSKLISPAHHSEYLDKVRDEFADDISKFIEDFRNYTLHFGIPKISHVFTIPGEKWCVALDLHKLKDWSGWTSKSRSFFASHPDQIQLAWLVSTYQTKSMKMHDWLVRSFTRFYREQFDDFDRLQASLRTAAREKTSP